MRRMGDLMKDLGFNADAPVETQKAFIRHLIHVANGTAPKRTIPLPVQNDEPSQLSFDPEIIGHPVASAKTKRQG